MRFAHAAHPPDDLKTERIEVRYSMINDDDDTIENQSSTRSAQIMIDYDRHQAEPGRISFRKVITTLVVSVILGASIPFTRKLILGNPDPFSAGWPLFLQATACLAAFMVSWRWNHGVTSAVGLYAGLVGYLMAWGNPEYPAASMIALAIHGFIPALSGSLVAFAMCRRSGRLVKSRSKA